VDKVESIQSVAETFLRLVNKFKVLEKIPIDHGTGHLLYASEINTLDLIGKHPGINMTRLADRRGVTIGAVSQVVARLVKKELVRKTHLPESKKELSLQVTDLGAIALRNHDRFHAKHDQPIIDKVSAMSPEQLQAVVYVFQLFEESIDNYLNELK